MRQRACHPGRKLFLPERTFLTCCLLWVAAVSPLLMRAGFSAPVTRNLQVSVDQTDVSVDMFETTPPKLTASGLAPGDAIKVAVYWDLNRNGKVDTSEPLGALYRIVDGAVSRIGGVRNGNVPGDEDLQANARIETELRGVLLGRITAVEGNALLKVWNEAAPSQIAYQTVRVRFPAEGQRISGTVVDTKDRPIPGAIVSCSPCLHGGGPKIFCFADANGAFSIPTAPGSYVLEYWSASHFHSDTFSNSQVDVVEGTNVFTRGVLRDFVSNRKFSGQVVQTSGEPVPGTLLFLGASEQKKLVAVSDEAGRFSFNADVDRYEFCPDSVPFLALSPLGLVGNPARDSNVDLRSASVSGVTHRLAQKAQSMVYGKFQTDGGEALAGMVLRSRDYTTGSDFNERGADVSVRADGSFWMPTDAGSFSLDFEDDLRGFVGCRWISSQSLGGSQVNLANGAALDVGDVVAHIGTVNVKGRLTDTGGRPYTLLRYEGAWNVSLRADGSFSFKSDPWGAMNFTIGDGEGYGAFTQELNVDIPDGTQEGSVIDLGSMTADPKVSGRPRVRLQSSGTVVTQGASLRLSASAAGGGTLVYKWFKNGQRIAGQSGATLSLVGNTASNGTAGVYTVEVSNAYGRAESNAVTLR